jgi:hypothetical protein
MQHICCCVANCNAESFRHALITDPWGEVIGRLEDPQGTGEVSWAGRVRVARDCVR